MPDTSPTPTVDERSFRSLRRLTYISLGLNALILLLIFCAAQHDRKERREERFRHDGPGFMARDGRGFGPGGFHRGGGGFGNQCPAWGGGPGGPGGFQGRGPGGGMGFRQGGFGGQQGPMGGGPGGPGMGGPGIGTGPGGPGMGFGHGMMGGPGGTPPDPAVMTDGILAMLTQKLTLTDDQKAKLKPIIQDQVTQMQKDMEAQRAAMQKKIEDAKAKIKPILNADQQKQLDAMPLPGQKPPAPADKK